MSYDLAFVGNELTGGITVHTATCPVARKAADNGQPVMTAFGCERLPGDGYTLHDCVEKAYGR